MAKVIVAGEVDAIKETKTGKPIINLIEEYQSQLGEKWVRKWTLWAGFDGVLKGDFIEVEGELSTKAVEWTNDAGQVKQIIDHNLNGVTLIKHVSNFKPEPVSTVDEDDRRKYGSGLAPF